MPGSLDSPQALAALSRELAVNDWQERPAAPGAAGQPDGRRGKVEDRNVELLVRAPFALPAPPHPKQMTGNHGRQRRSDGADPAAAARPTLYGQFRVGP